MDQVAAGGHWRAVGGAARERRGAHRYAHRAVILCGTLSPRRVAAAGLGRPHLDRHPPLNPTDATDGRHMPIRLPRRAALAGGAAGLCAALAGCSGRTGTDPGGSDTAAQVSRARGLRRSAARASDALLARYVATATAHPGLAGVLAPFQDTVARHLRGLRGPGATRLSTPAALSPADVPEEPDRALSELIDAERQTADARFGALGDAPPDVARLLASLAAAGAVQVFLLTEARNGARP